MNELLRADTPREIQVSALLLQETSTAVNGMSQVLAQQSTSIDRAVSLLGDQQKLLERQHQTLKENTEANSRGIELMAGVYAQFEGIVKRVIDTNTGTVPETYMRVADHERIVTALLKNQERLVRFVLWAAGLVLLSALGVVIARSMVGHYFGAM